MMKGFSDSEGFVDFFLTSALTQVNLKQCFEKLVKTIFDRNLQVFEDPFKRSIMLASINKNKKCYC